MTEGIDQPNKKKSERSEKKKSYMYSGILEADAIKQ